ncbi:hypothetical protein PYW08_006935 [Mythimna loreyi]|uniref:Uncharacterized protein n=1 Tax=Mythimna loreyi TaxID=667449 RepID=A0ACC2R998_9NEOP|nr:hypothetical protein PYW08_006935 [Mythimna loreyi]
MMTRGATVRDINNKLNAALKELEVSRKTCSDLLQEREESEVEVKKLVDKNTQLKRQLVEMHTQHEDILDQHNHLRRLVSEFQECRDTHDCIASQALKRNCARRTTLLPPSILRGLGNRLPTPITFSTS